MQSFVLGNVLVMEKQTGFMMTASIQSGEKWFADATIRKIKTSQITAVEELRYATDGAARMVNRKNINNSMNELSKAASEIAKKIQSGSCLIVGAASGKLIGIDEQLVIHEITTNPTLVGMAEELENEKKCGNEVHDYLVSCNPDNQYLSVIEAMIEQRRIQNQLQARVAELEAAMRPHQQGLSHDQITPTIKFNGCGDEPSCPATPTPKD